MKLVHALGIFALLIVVAVSSNQAQAKTCKNADNVTYVQGGRHCLAIKTFPAGTGTETLVIVLHGDLSRGGPADYIFPVAKSAASRTVSAVVMMRPGYTGDGRKSTGRPSRSQSRNELYKRSEIDSIGVAISELKSHYGAKQLILVGHSGGALISGVLLGRQPDLVDGVVLIACPCNVPRWRQKRGRNPLPLAQSPHKWLKHASAGAKIVAITGSDDRNTFPDLAREYVAAAKARGLDAEFLLVQGAGHGLRRQYREPILGVLNKLMTR